MRNSWGFVGVQRSSFSHCAHGPVVAGGAGSFWAALGWRSEAPLRWQEERMVAVGERVGLCIWAGGSQNSLPPPSTRVWRKGERAKGGWRLLLGECGQAFLEMRRCLSRSYFSKCLIKGITKARWEAWCAAGLLGAHWPQTRGLIWTLCEERSGDQEQINPHWVDDSCPSREMKFPSGSLPQRCLACGLEPGSLSCMYVKVRVDGQMDNAHHGVYHKENLPQSTILDYVCTPLQNKFFFTD